MNLNRSVLKIAILLIGSLFVIGLWIFQYKSEDYREHFPTISMVDSQTKSIASVIQVGLHLVRFTKFSTQEGEFTMDAIVWFKYPQASETLYAISQFDFALSKPVQANLFIHRSEPMIKVLGKDILVSYHVSTTFSCPLDHTHFPMTDHKISFILQNRSASERELVFECEEQDFTLGESIVPDIWNPRKTYVKAGYLEDVVNPRNSAMNVKHPCVAFAIDFKSMGGRRVISLYFPLLVIFFICMLALMLDIFHGARLSIVTAALPALVFFRLVIDNASPLEGTITHIDFVFYTFILLALIILLVQTYLSLLGGDIETLRPDEQAAKKEHLYFINDVIFFFLAALFVLLMVINYFR